MDLKSIFQAITDAESKLVPVLVTNPESQAIAAVAFLAEQSVFQLIVSLHAAKKTAPVVAADEPVAAPVESTVSANTINLGIASGLLSAS